MLMPGAAAKKDDDPSLGSVVSDIEDAVDSAPKNPNAAAAKDKGTAAQSSKSGSSCSAADCFKEWPVILVTVCAVALVLICLSMFFLNRSLSKKYQLVLQKTPTSGTETETTYASL